MTFLGNWFKKKDSDDYEAILQSLKLEIEARQTRLSEIRLRERRATLLITLYTLAAWVAYVGVWYTGILPKFGPVGRGGRETNLGKTLQGLPVVVGPVLYAGSVLFIRRLVQLWYTRKGNAEEKHLKKLMIKQRNTIEEIKKKTNYYSTKNLIERYDEPSTPSRPSAQAPQTPVGLRQRPQGAASASRPNPPTPINPNTPVRPNGFPPSLSPAPQPLPPPRKQWYDKVADALLGEDDASSGAHSRYALICQNCFSHNGLVRESEWETTQYKCPKCGFFNASPKSKKAGANTLAPPGVAGLPASPVALGVSMSQPGRPRPSSPPEHPGKVVPSNSLESHPEAVDDSVNEGDSVRMEVDTSPSKD
ncbi:hypothetical protein SISNIDRAFT_463924 [Sistotremastrum niveocremeum HHB9708]|uniref:Endoplasmic reticulum junction formation protein lunapark n=1 Tax=Sistotremastrum niveocremeum HHB9708 TaxID=1314777 RepID=A0A164XZP6_9AGAM|nr:hypothetical protein SISNIDRAFT_463924 [Sistotremastrum niveocremeum HHB9708]